MAFNPVPELLALHAAGRFKDMERAARAALRAAPDAAVLDELLGIALTAQRKHADALPHLEKAARQSPADAQFWENLGLCQAELKRHESAEHSLRRSLSIRPRSAGALNALGLALRGQGRLAEAQEIWRQATAIDPSHEPAFFNFVNILIKFNQFSEAERLLLARVSRRPSAEAYVRLAQLYTAAFRRKDAIAMAEEVLRRLGDPLRGIDKANLHQREIVADAFQAGGRPAEAARIYGAIFAASGDANHALRAIYAAREACDWEYAAEIEKKLRKLEPDLAHPRSPVSSPFVTLMLASATASEQLGCGRSWATTVALEAAVFPHTPRKNSGRLRIGYFSSDFREHVTAHLIAGVIEKHDRGRFEIVAYDFSPPSQDAYRQRMQSAFDRMVPIAHLSNAAAAKAINDDRADIVIDLAGWTTGHRAGVLALKPAPIQAYWLGSPGSTGAPWIDYLIADRTVIPASLEAFFSEKILAMPHCYLPTDMDKPVGSVRARTDYGLPENGFVFASFNRAYKITADVFAVWMDLLKAIPDSVLWLLDTAADARNAIGDHAAQHGVDRNRIVFAPAVPDIADHMARVRCADLALDCFPYGSHTTGADMLLAGVPFVGLSGVTFASRVSASILAAAGMSELIVSSLDDYRELALRLARDPAALTILRARLAGEGRQSPLFDVEGFTRALEEGLLRIWKRQEQGLPPESVSAIGP
jgi:predicted O-linked N-acetylglucosamine transferase (SPINDLY family)